jgi:hypothetical protein
MEATNGGDPRARGAPILRTASDEGGCTGGSVEAREAALVDPRRSPSPGRPHARARCKGEGGRRGLAGREDGGGGKEELSANTMPMG